MKQIKKQESGRSMIEMVGVLAVMGLITAGAFVLIQSGMSSQRRSHAVDDVSNIVATYRALFAEDGDFDALNDQSAKYKAAVQPSAMGLPAHNPWGGDYIVSGDGTTLTVQVTGLSDSECTVMTTRKWAGEDADAENSCTGTNSGTVVLNYVGF